MTTLATSACSEALSGKGSPPAGEIGWKVFDSAREAINHLKADKPARTSFAFNDLQSLAHELGPDANCDEVIALAQRFLLALPGSLPAPEVALDDDGEITFDWRGRRERMLTVALREDGRLAYACRLSSFDKEHGIKRFNEAVPKRILELVQQVASA